MADVSPDRLAGSMRAMNLAAVPPGALLLVVAASLARVALARTDRHLFVVAVGLLAVTANVGVAFLAGAAWWLLRTRGFRRPGANPET